MKKQILSIIALLALANTQMNASFLGLLSHNAVSQVIPAIYGVILAKKGTPFTQYSIKEIQKKVINLLAINLNDYDGSQLLLALTTPVGVACMTQSISKSVFRAPINCAISCALLAMHDKLRQPTSWFFGQ